MITPERQEELIRRAQRGDLVAMGTLLHAAIPVIRRTVAALIPDGLGAVIEIADIVQEVMVDFARGALNHLDYRGPNSFDAFATRIAHDKVIDALRASRTERDFKARQTAAGSHGNEADAGLRPLPTTPDPPSTPSRRAARGEACRIVRAAVDALPPGNREAIKSTYFTGASVRSAARRLGVTRPVVHGQLRRARKQLRQILGDASRFPEFFNLKCRVGRKS